MREAGRYAAILSLGSRSKRTGKVDPYLRGQRCGGKSGLLPTPITRLWPFCVGRKVRCTLREMSSVKVHAI
jgi:hypothetical protein